MIDVRVIGALEAGKLYAIRVPDLPLDQLDDITQALATYQEEFNVDFMVLAGDITIEEIPNHLQSSPKHNTP